MSNVKNWLKRKEISNGKFIMVILAIISLTFVIASLYYECYAEHYECNFKKNEPKVIESESINNKANYEDDYTDCSEEKFKPFHMSSQIYGKEKGFFKPFFIYGFVYKPLFWS